MRTDTIRPQQENQAPHRSARKFFRDLLGFRECEVFVRKDAPQACTTVLADFSTVCGCSCCGVTVA